MRPIGILLVALLSARATVAAPLQLLKIRNLTLLFVETSDGKQVDILYAPDKIERFPLEVRQKTVDELQELSDLERLRSGRSYGSEYSESNDEDFDPELDGPRLGENIIQAPNFKPSPCGNGLRRDKNGRCRRVW